MKIINIAKKNGKTRKIYVPNNGQKNALRNLIDPIADKASKLDIYNVSHGFTHKRSPVTNAIAHKGYKYTTSFDLADFFDSVKPEHVHGKIPVDYIDRVFIDGAPRQGLPTSPVVANVAASSMDTAIVKFIKKHSLECVYTRYADDLTFSYNDGEIHSLLTVNIPNIVSMCGFKINPDKTHTQFAGVGRRIITGIAVDDEIHPTRKIKRKLRAAIHQENKFSIMGLEEWSKLKLPREITDYKKELLKLKNIWNIKELDINIIPLRPPDEWYADDVVITGDPVYILGMSSFTNGWTSCMTWPQGKHRRTTIAYVYISGIRVALLLSDKTKTIGGVTRREILARSIIADCEDGNTYHRNFYGYSTEIKILKNVLKNNGIDDNAKTIYVKGRSCYKPRYLDQFSSNKVGNYYRLLV